MVLVISVNTGEIPDYEVKSLFCYECKANARDQGSDEYKKRQKDHESNCSINHKSSSEEMEAVAAVDILAEA